MKIQSVKLHSAVNERQYATVIAKEGGAAKRAVAKSHFIFLEVTADNGLTGWGEISDIEPDELPKDRDEYQALLADLLRGRSPFEVQKLHHDLREHFDLENSSLARCASCALDMVMYDLAGKATKRPAYDLLGGAVRDEVVISWVAFIREDLDLLREEIREKRKAGFHAYKLKVGVDAELDEQRVAIAREVAGKDASIKLDANEGWSVEEAPRNIRRLNKFKLAGVETPVPREDPADIAAVRRQVDVPILEHVSDLKYGLALIKAEAVDAFNVATTGAGGLWPARQIVTLAQSAKVGVLLGSTVEMGPGTLAQLHFAATVPNLTLPSDLVGPGLYRKDVFEAPIKYRNGKLRVPNQPGLGGVVNREKLRSLSS